MGQDRTDIAVFALHVCLHRLSEREGHHQRPNEVGAHNDPAQMWWVDGRGQIAHLPVVDAA